MSTEENMSATRWRSPSASKLLGQLQLVARTAREDRTKGTQALLSHDLQVAQAVHIV